MNDLFKLLLVFVFGFLIYHAVMGIQRSHPEGLAGRDFKCDQAVFAAHDPRTMRGFLIDLNRTAPLSSARRNAMDKWDNRVDQLNGQFKIGPENSDGPLVFHVNRVDLTAPNYPLAEVKILSQPGAGTFWWIDVKDIYNQSQDVTK